MFWLLTHTHTCNIPSSENVTFMKWMLSLSVDSSISIVKSMHFSWSVNQKAWRIWILYTYNVISFVALCVLCCNMSQAYVMLFWLIFWASNTCLLNLSQVFYCTIMDVLCMACPEHCWFSEVFHTNFLLSSQNVHPYGTWASIYAAQ
jgi:hypothetical protein